MTNISSNDSNISKYMAQQYIYSRIIDTGTYIDTLFNTPWGTNAEKDTCNPNLLETKL